MARGQHLYISRGPYAHHVIDEGGGWVIHYWSPTGWERGEVMPSRLEDVARGCDVHAVSYSLTFEPEEVIRRACSRLGEVNFNLASSNCEHFARWCATGQPRSEQVERLQATAGGGVAAGTAASAGLGTVTAIGTAAGLSGGASVMTGLAQIGGVVGGGAAAGIAVVGVLPGVAGSLAMDRVLADDPYLSDRERAARQQGRTAGRVGAAFGTVGTVAAVAVSGTAGLSGVGIATGLAAMGELVGGGMIAGVALSAAAPAVLAAGVAYWFYKAAGGGQHPKHDR